MSKNTVKHLSSQEIIDLFPVSNKRVEIQYTGGRISSDGGLMMLKEVDNQLGLIQSICACIGDNRDPRYITHSLSSILSQRVYQIAAGYEDGNDCNSLRQDPILKLCSGQLPDSNEALGSQPTMSRFENSIRRSELYKIAKTFVMNFINSYESEPPVIILDADDTNNNAYGEQLEIEFNDYYGEYVFMPLHIYEGLSGKLITCVLKPGRRSKNVEVFAIMKRIIKLLREHWKNTMIILRGDSHFHCPQLASMCQTDKKLGFVTGLTGNPVLYKICKDFIESCNKEYQKTKEPVKRYHSFLYKAQSWEVEERVIIKVEVNQKGKNIRFIATNLHQYRTRSLYETAYCARGSMELRIKDHKTYLKSDRTSCHRFEANQFRVFLHSAAYVLMHTLQKEVLRATEFANATMETIQLKLIKVAAKVKEFKTKIKIELPRCYAEKQIQIKAYKIFGAIRT